ncbi:triple tyrosine motif-containing protein [Thermophagus xiamenensis]|uniref:Two component regulator propeller n=1 Tax=Thermophagus xiamenensis TaxID=385682 RepID=A0A1I2AHZ9_9BACT|nr:triple tyrosine motif-containing protein [Thermophagus xiamenensis]SFE42460.1 Two component regulator propeller [Thermophagus xiamenensis]
MKPITKLRDIPTLFIKLFVFIALFITVSITGKSAPTLQPQIINFNKQHYHGANKNWSIAFDGQGFTYIGNSIGLIEFDGVSWQLYPSPNGFPIRAIAIDSLNRIYTGGYREIGFWERNNLGQLEYTSLTDSVEGYFARNEEFWNIFIVNNKVYFQSFSGIYVFDKQHFAFIRANGFISRSSVLNNELVVAIKSRGLLKIKNHGLTPFLQSDFFVDKNVTFFAPSSFRHHYLIGTETNGMFLYEAQNQQAREWPSGQTKFFVQNNINKGIIRPDSSIVIGTILNGIKIFSKDGKELYHLTKQSGLQSNTVHSLACDSTGNIWVASDKGLDFITFSSLTSYTPFIDDSPGAMYSAAIQDGIFYAGTNQGLFFKPWNAPAARFRLVPGTQRQVWDCQIIDSTLFVGHNAGTYVVENGKATKISNIAGGYSITNIPGHNDYLLQSTYSDLVVYRKLNQKWTFSHTLKGFSDLIRFVEFDHRNNLWAAHLYNGLYKIRLNEDLDSATQITYYGKNSNLWRQGHSIRVFKIENRIVFTNNEMLYTYDDLNDNIVPYDFLNNSLGHYASSFLIVPAPENRYWFINHRGIALYLIRNNNVQLIKEFPITLFLNNLIPREENIVPIDAHRAILCLENGYALLDTRAEDSGDRITREQLTIREIVALSPSGNRKILSPFTSKIVIPYSRNNLSLRYSFPLFTAETIKYQYKIEGLTPGWSEPIDKPVFTVNRIPTGEYTISVRAINLWQKTSKTHQIKLEVKPPWYQSTPAFFIYALLFSGLFFLGKNITVKRVKLKEKQKREEKERELIRLRNEKLQSELSFKSRQLANSTLEMIKKNEFLMSLKEKLKHQKELLGTRYPDKYYSEIIKKIDDHISGEDEWKIFEHNFNQAHETFLQTLKEKYPQLTPGDLRLCAFLRINLTSKEIAPLLGISVRGVENHRYRLRKKLGLSPDTDLTEFILSFRDGKKE